MFSYVHDLCKVMMDKYLLETLGCCWVHYGVNGLEAQTKQSIQHIDHNLALIWSFNYPLFVIMVSQENYQKVETGDCLV